MTEKDLGQIIPDILATATVDNKVGEPAVNVTVEQINEVNRLERKFNFEFVNMKGEKGDTPVKGVDYLTEEEKQQFTTETLSLVSNESTKQVKAVTDKGAEEVGKVTDEGNKQISLTQAEALKVIEQLKKLIEGNPETSNAQALSGKTRVEFEQDIENTLEYAKILKNTINNSFIEHFTPEYINLFSEGMSMNKGFIGTDGVTYDSEVWKHVLIEVKEQSTYRIISHSASSVGVISLFDINKKLLHSKGTTEEVLLSETIFTVPKKAKYVAIQICYKGTEDYKKVGLWSIDSLKYKMNIDNVSKVIKESRAFYQSNNLFNPSYVEDGKLLSFNSGHHVDYKDSIISGYVPVEVGKTYTISNGNNLYANVILFYNKDKKVICASHDYTGIPSANGFVEVSGDKQVITFKLLPDSNIAFASWYIAKSPDNNYYGSHNNLDGIIDYIQMNEGDCLLPFEKNDLQYDDFIHNINKGLTNIEKNTNLIKENTNSINKLKEEFKRYNIFFIKSDNKIQVRSEWNTEQDITIHCDLKSSLNHSFNLLAYKLVNKSTDYLNFDSGTVFKGSYDDIAPFYFNNSYVGANHGWDRCYEIATVSEHGLVESNIGELWHDDINQEILILSILSTKKILVCSPSSDIFSSNLGILKNNTLVGSITNDSKTLLIQTVTRTQLRPAINNKKIKVLNSKSVEIINDGIYQADYFDIVETYNIFDIQTMINKLKSNVGNNKNDSYYSDDIIEKYCTVNIIYRFTERGAMTVFQTIDFDKIVNWSFGHFVQSETIGNYIIVPNTLYKNITLIDKEDIAIDKNSWINKELPPARFYQFSDINRTKGMCLGFNTFLGSAKPEIQKTSTETGFYYNETKKMYPKLSCKVKNTTIGESVNAICYRVPLREYDKDMSVGWYYVNDNIYLLIDCQKSINKFIELPKHMLGKEVEIVESYGNTNIPIPFVSPNGIKIIVNEYGSLILKLK